MLRGVSLIIPALNEAGAIGATLRELPWDLLSECIIVDNGSADSTAEEARRNGARVVSEPRRGFLPAADEGVGESPRIIHRISKGCDAYSAGALPAQERTQWSFRADLSIVSCRTVTGLRGFPCHANRRGYLLVIEALNICRDIIEAVFHREVTGIETMHFRVRQIAQV